MSSYDSCPYCGREAKDALTSNWFPVYTCLNCKTKYCENDGPACPGCGSLDYGKYDRFYAWYFLLSKS
jgi:RNA polymerase subunit RPABC4/transcription elongation factor Spt4